MEPFSAIETLTRQVQQWESWEKFSKQQVKLWRELSDLLQQGQLAKCQKLLSQVEASQIPALPSPEAGEAVKTWCQNEERQRPLRFSKQLREAAEAAGVPCQTIGSSPPTLRLDPLTIELDFKKGEALVTYARQEVGRTPLDAELILRERAKLLASLESADFQAEEYLRRVYEAYRRCLASAGHKLGERIDLVDLARLRRCRVLEHQGARLTLGTATLGSTRHKDRVLFLEEAGQGQYYLSLAFQGGPSR